MSSPRLLPGSVSSEESQLPPAHWKTLHYQQVSLNQTPFILFPLFWVMKCSLFSSRISFLLHPTLSCANCAGFRGQSLKRLPAMWETWVRSLGWQDPLQKEMAAHSSILAWRIPWMEEPGGIQSTGSQRVGHNWATSLHFQMWLGFVLPWQGSQAGSPVWDLNPFLLGEICSCDILPYVGHLPRSVSQLQCISAPFSCVVVSLYF